MESQIFDKNCKIIREEIKSVIDGGVDLKGLRDALIQKRNSGSPRSSSALSPSSCSRDYPVFLPSNGAEYLYGYHHILSKNQSMSGNWDLAELKEIEDNGEECLSDIIKKGNSHRKESFTECSQKGSSKDDKSSIGSRSNEPDDVKCTSQMNGMIELPPSDMGCKFATINKGIQDSKAESYSKYKLSKFSWVFPGLKKKSRGEAPRQTVQYEYSSNGSRNSEKLSIESRKKELVRANERREAALLEAASMKSSITELEQKVALLESDCKRLKDSLKFHKNSEHIPDQLNRKSNLTKIRKPKPEPFPVSHEAMVEGFLQIVSESRTSVKHFCKHLVAQVEESGDDLVKKLSPFSLTRNRDSDLKYSKMILYHLQARVNQVLYQNYENCVFQENGSPNILHPEKERLANFSSFVALRNLNCHAIIRKENFYSEEFNKVFEEKKNAIESFFGLSRPWPDELLESFLVSAKCVWMLHLLSFSFKRPFMILRVEENRIYDPLYMEDILLERRSLYDSAVVETMVMPGFYVEEEILRCKVLCKRSRPSEL